MPRWVSALGGGQLTRYHLSVQFSSHRFSCPTAEVQLQEMPRWVVVCRIPNVTQAGGISKAPRLTCDSRAAAAAWGRVDNTGEAVAPQEGHQQAGTAQTSRVPECSWLGHSLIG